jgi:hypothetical protein
VEGKKLKAGILEAPKARELEVPNTDVLEEPNADELKAGAEVPCSEENVEVFGANGLLELGVVLEKGLADD